MSANCNATPASRKVAARPAKWPVGRPAKPYDGLSDRGACVGWRIRLAAATGRVIHHAAQLDHWLLTDAQ